MTDILKKIIALLPASDRPKLAGIFVLMFIAGILEAAGLGLVLAFVSSLADPDRVLGDHLAGPILATAGVTDVHGLLVYGSIALIALFLFKNLYLLLFQHIQTTFVFDRFRLLAERLFGQYLYAPYAFHLQHNTAVLVRNVTQEVNLLVERVMLSLLILSMECIMAAFVILFLLILEPTIAVSTFIFFGGAGYLFARFSKERTKAFGAQAFEHRAEMIRRVNEGLGGIREVSLSRRQPWFLEQFAQSAEAYAKAESFSETIKRSFKPAVETAAVAGMLGISLLLFWEGRDISAVIPILALFGAASFKLIPSFEKISNHYHSIRYHGHALSLVYDDLIRSHEEKALPEISSSPLRISREIAVEGVWYTYPESSLPAARGLSFTVSKGEAVGLVGPTGGGKSTAADLVAGLLTPSKGSIRVDGRDIREDLAGWQKSIGYVSQSIYLADASIRRNIAFGINDEDIDEAALKNAVEMAQLDEMIARLPDGLETIVGERGARLSGGQRQRIGIARALYGNPDVLIMDEATSALDSRTEEYVISAIERLKKGRTILMIAHRLSTVKNCDKLVVIRNGEVATTGTYEEVLPQL